MLKELSKPITRWIPDIPKDPLILDVMWKKIGPAPNVVTMTGYVEGHLYATTSTMNFYAETLLLANVPWERIGDSNNVIAMAAPFEMSGRLFGATKSNELLLRDAVRDAKWEPHLKHINNVVTIACMWPEPLYVVNKKHELWCIGMDGKEFLIGNCPDIVALAALDDNLFAATRDNRLLCRDTVTVDITWTDIGEAPEHVSALAAYYGILFAATRTQ